MHNGVNVVRMAIAVMVVGVAVAIAVIAMVISARDGIGYPGSRERVEFLCLCAFGVGLAIGGTWLAFTA